METKIVSLFQRDEDATTLQDCLGHQTYGHDGHVYGNDKKTHQKRHRAGHAKHQRRDREIITWN